MYTHLSEKEIEVIVNTIDPLHRKFVSLYELSAHLNFVSSFLITHTPLPSTGVDVAHILLSCVMKELKLNNSGVKTPLAHPSPRNSISIPKGQGQGQGQGIHSTFNHALKNLNYSVGNKLQSHVILTVLSLICTSVAHEEKLFELFLPLFDRRKSNRNIEEMNNIETSNDNIEIIEQPILTKENCDENYIKNKKNQLFEIRELLGLNSKPKNVAVAVSIEPTDELLLSPSLPEEKEPSSPRQLLQDNETIKSDITLDKNEKKNIHILKLLNSSSKSEADNNLNFNLDNFDKELGINNPSKDQENLKSSKDEDIRKTQDDIVIELNIDLDAEISIEEVCEYILSSHILNEFLESQIRSIMYQLIIISNKCSV